MVLPNGSRLSNTSYRVASSAGPPLSARFEKLQLAETDPMTASPFRSARNLRGDPTAAEKRLQFKLSTWLPEEYLKCALCNSFQREVFLLPCFHTVCAACSTNDKCKGNSCDPCREHCDKKFAYKSSEPTDLSGKRQRNEFVQGLRELALCLTEHSDQVCDYCNYEGKRREATHRCIECKDDLCEACVAAHKRTKVTRHHGLISYSDIRAGLHLDKLRFAPPCLCDECNEEGGKDAAPATTFCSDCDKFLCPDCRNHSETSHANHHCLSVELSQNQAKARLGENTVDIMERQEVLQLYSEGLSDYQDRLEANREDLVQRIHERVKILHEELENMAQETIVEVNDATEAELGLIKDNLAGIYLLLAKIDSAKTYVTSISKYGRADEILRSSKWINQRVDELRDLDFNKITSNLVISFAQHTEADPEIKADLKAMIGLLTTTNVADDNLIGIFPDEVQLSEVEDEKENEAIITENLVTEVTPRATQISTCPETFEVTNASAFDFQLSPKTDSQRETPSNKTILDKIKIVTDFEAKAKTDSRDVWPTGIAVHPLSNAFYILDRDNAKIKLFNDDGALMTAFGGQWRRNSIDAKSLTSKEGLGSPFDLTLSEATRNLYVTDYQLEEVRAFTMDGMALGALPTGKLKHPRGIASNASNLLAVVESRKGCISVFDLRSNGRTPVTSLGDSAPPLTEPYYVDFVDERNLVVTDWASPNLRVYSLRSGKCEASTAAYGIGAQQMLKPFGVSWDTSTGNVFVADHANHRIQTVQITKDAVTGSLKLEQMHELAGKLEHDIWHPLAIASDTSRGRLIITEALGRVKVLQVS